MSELIETGELFEVNCGDNFSVVINDESNFFSTEYKVLQSKDDCPVLKCMRMKLNGKVQLLYFTDGLKPFNQLRSTLNFEKTVTVFINILSAIIKIQENGFLSCRNINVDLDKIYVDVSTLRVRLMYLPLVNKYFNDDSVFVNIVRTNFLNYVSNLTSLQNFDRVQLISVFSSDSFSLEDMYRKLLAINRGESGGLKNECTMSENLMTVLRLVAVGSAYPFTLCVNRSGYKLGKKAEAVDGVIDFNRAISRVHCRLDFIDGNWTVTDLNSVNGTFINKERLQPDKSYLISNGDVLRLANSDFKVQIG